MSDEQLQTESENRESMAADIATLRTELRKSHAEKNGMIADAQKREKEVDARLGDAMLQLRLIQGNLEKREIRQTEETHQTEVLSTQQAKATEVLRSETGGQIGAVRGDIETIRQAVGAQEKSVAALSQEVSVIKETLPALSAQSQRIDAVEEQGQKSRRADIGQINKRLDQFSKTIDQFGEKIFSKFDEQEGLLRKTTQRLDALEKRAGAKQ